MSYGGSNSKIEFLPLRLSQELLGFSETVEGKEGGLKFSSPREALAGLTRVAFCDFICSKVGDSGSKNEQIPFS